MVLDIVRRYVKSFFAGLFVLVLVIIFIGFLRKLYDLSGLKNIWKRAESEDDGNLEGGSARRLLEGAEEDDSEDRPMNGKQFPKSARRQHSNSDSGNQAEIVRSKSEVRSQDEFGRRARTLSESGAGVPMNSVKPSSNQALMDREMSKVSDSSQPTMSRQSSQMSSKPVKHLIHNLKTVMTSANSVQETSSALRKEDSHKSLGPEQSIQQNSRELSQIVDEEYEDAEMDSNNEPSTKSKFLRYLVGLFLTLFLASSFMIFGCMHGLLIEDFCSFVKNNTASSRIIKDSAQVSLAPLKTFLRTSLLQIFPQNSSYVATIDSFLESLDSYSSGSASVVLGVTFVFALSTFALCRQSPKKKIKRTSSSGGSTASGEKPSPKNINTNIPPTPSSQSSRGGAFTPRSGKIILSLDYPTFVESKLKQTLTVWKCDSSKGAELPSETVMKNVIDQCATFCVVITADEYGRNRCLDELKYALATKGTDGIAVILLDSAVIMNTPSAFQHALESVPLIVTWPAEWLKRGGGIYSEESKAMCSLTDFVRRQRDNLKGRFLWDIYLSHFRTSNQEIISRSVSTSHSSSPIVTALATMISTLSDASSLKHISNIVQSMIASQAISQSEGAVFLALIQEKTNIDRWKRNDLELPDADSTGHSTSGSVVDVPISPHRFGQKEEELKRNAETLKFLNTNSETARQISLSERSNSST